MSDEDFTARLQNRHQMVGEEPEMTDKTSTNSH